jgi:transcriptional regulator GlxA family with amidase domain
VRGCEEARASQSRCGRSVPVLCASSNGTKVGSYPNGPSFARRNLHKRLAVEDLANAANLSARQFTRAFMAEIGQSPAKAIEKLRVEGARLLIEQGRHPVEVIVHETGFADCERMRRAFLRAFGQPRLAIRRNIRAAA